MMMKILREYISTIVRLVLASVIVLTASMSFAFASVSKKVALVIGNGQYQEAAPLNNPRHDATDMTLKLKTLGFEVISGTDLELTELRRTVRRFIDKTQDADVALFFYAGHGLQVGGQNYLLPVDAKLEKESDLDFETLPVHMVLNAMERNAKATLMFLDACRNNPLTRGLARSMGTRSSSLGTGLAEIGSGVGTLISFATKPGAVALDGTGRNSPFTTALLRHIGTPDQDIARTLISVRKDVLAATNQAQVPWENSSLTRRIVLNDVSGQQEVAAVSPSASETKTSLVPVESRAVNNDNLLQVEIAFWNSVERAGTAEGYKTYLSNYPTGAFAQLAQIQLRKINGAKMTPQLMPKQEQPKEDEVKVAALDQSQTTPSEPVQSSQTAQPANEVATATPVETPKPELSEYERVYGIQQQLTRLGCAPGVVDGIAGGNTQSALNRYSRASGNDLRSLGYSADVLEILKNEKTIFCPAQPSKRIASVSSDRKKSVQTRNVKRETRTQRASTNRVSRSSRKQRRARERRRVDHSEPVIVERRRPRRVIVERERDEDFERREHRRRVATGIAAGIAGAIIFGN